MSPSTATRSGSEFCDAAISLAVASAGAAVAVNYRQRENEAADVVAAIERASGRAISVRADVSVRDDVKAMIDEVGKRLGLIDVLVSNAVTATIVDIDHLAQSESDRMLTDNLKSAFLCTQSVLPACGRGAGAAGMGNAPAPRNN